MADTNGYWVQATTLGDLEARGRAVVKRDGKQILVIKSGFDILACANRCPHEGYPLSEGSLSDDCVLTCNWHNWKFDLKSGETLMGGDSVRLFPVRIDDGVVFVDVTDPPPEDRRKKALEGLSEAFDDHDYPRIAREVARFERAGGASSDLLVEAFRLARDRLEYGITHAQAGAADWLALASRRASDSDGEADGLVPIIEIIGNLSWDSLMDHGRFPYPKTVADSFDAAVLESAIEAENEERAIAQTRRAIADGDWERLRTALDRASLRHYQDFGHSAIYCEKTFELFECLGPASATNVFLPLVRGLCMGTREDLIPEFRAYAPALGAWCADGSDVPDPNDFRNLGVAACLDRISASGGRIEDLYDVLMQAAADQMLHYDAAYRSRIDGPIQDNIDWLDFTHAITHLNAVRRIAERQPDLWRHGLLQTGCFLGRNTGYVDWTLPVDRYAVDDPDAFLDRVFDQVLDHGEPAYIFPVHVLKLTTAIREEIRLRPKAPFVPTLLAALNRFVQEPMKRKHTRRVAAQAMNFVALQG